MKRCLATVVALLLPLAVAAQPVWRCGADGRSYSDAPCADGRVVAVADPRDAQALAQGRAAAALDRRLAHDLVAERHERERLWRAQGGGAASLGPVAELTARPKAAAKERPPKKPKAQAKPKSRPGAGAGTSRTTDHATRRMPG